MVSTLSNFGIFMLIVLGQRDHTSASIIQPVETIKFVVTNYDDCSFELMSDGTLRHLHQEMARICNIPMPFDIQSSLPSREMIVSPQSPQRMGQKFMKHPAMISMVKTLREFWGKDFLVPLRIRPRRPLQADIATYDALMRMFVGSESNVEDLSWYNLIKRCVESESCEIEYLCRQFYHNFQCSQQKLIIIDLTGHGLKGHIDLAALPPTVEQLRLAGNQLTEIHGLDQLAGKQLRYMGIRTSPCEIDLRPFEKSSPLSIGNPLRSISVDINQVKSSLVPDGREVSHRKLLRAGHEWLDRESILDTMWIVHHRMQRRKNRVFSQRII